MTAFTVVFGALSIARHRGLLTNAFDMGQMLQASWTIHHLAGNFSTVVGLPFLGDHSRFILYPMGILGLPAQGLLVAQALVLALGAVPLYLLTARRGPRWAGVLVAALYLGYPSLQWTALFDLHPEVLATTALLVAFWAVDSQRLRTYWAAVVVALLCREDVSVAVGLIGLVLVLERRRRIGFWTIGVSVLAFAVDTVAQKLANPFGLSVLAQRYGYLGDPPSLMWSQLQSLELPLNAGLMVLGFVLPAMLLLWARWTRLLAAFPFLVMSLLSTLAMQKTIYFHYGFIPTVFVFVAVSDGAVRVAAMRAGRRAVVLGASVLAAVVALPLTSPFFDVGYRGPGAWPRPASIQRQLADTFPDGFVDEARHAMSLVGDGSVAASQNFVPQLADRAEIWMLPNPFYPAWYGKYLTQDVDPDTTDPRVTADGPDWVVVDKIHVGPEPADERADLVALLPSHYTLVFEGQFVQVWEKKS